MPLTDFQKELARVLAKHRSPKSHLAGGAALHIQPNSIRYSQDLDYFHDTEKEVSVAFKKDQALLNKHGYTLENQIVQSGYIRVVAKKNNQQTKIEWAQDSMWRFFPVMSHPDSGFQLHDIDLAINKLLALAGRNEARDWVDVLYIDTHILSLGPLCWASIGKDPGFTPQSLLEQLRRKGRFQKEEVLRLHTVKKMDIVELKNQWLQSLETAEAFIQQRPHAEQGCLYLNAQNQNPYAPTPEQTQNKDYHVHYGQPGGLIPIIQ